jgi:DNA-binding CsgD family transcriptional regulator
MSKRGTSIEDAIYEAALVPDLWPDVLDQIATLATSKGAVAFCVGDAVRWTSSPGIHDDMTTFVTGGWLGRNTRVSEGMRNGVFGAHRFVVDEDIYGGDHYVADPMYAELFLPLGYGRSAGAGMILPHGDALVISVEKSFASGPVPPPALSDLDRLYPHLMRAAMVGGRLAFERLKSAVDTLAKLGMPAVAVDAGGRAIVGSPLWDSASADWTTAGRDRLVLHDANANRQLAAALDRATLAENGVGSIALRQRSGARAILQVIPVRRTANDLFARAAAVLVLSAPRDRGLAGLEVVQSLFDLTPAEALVAMGVANGRAPKDIARDTGKSVATVRNQVKAVMRKTGVNKAIELTGLLVDAVRHVPPGEGGS